MKYYLMVDLDARAIEVFESEEGAYKKKAGDDRFHFLLEDCTITPDFQTIFR